MPPTSRPIRIVIVDGSARPGNFTGKAVAIVADELQKDPRVHVEIINPGALILPMPGTDYNSPAAKELQLKVAAATAVVLATPEYHGSFSSVMKLTIENLGFPSVLSGKPVALLGVAAGAIGAIKSLEHLRGVVSHIGALALPLPISTSQRADRLRRRRRGRGPCRGELNPARGHQSNAVPRSSRLPARYIGTPPARGRRSYRCGSGGLTGHSRCTSSRLTVAFQRALNRSATSGRAVSSGPSPSSR